MSAIHQKNLQRVHEMLELQGYKLADLNALIDKRTGKPVPNTGIVEYHPASAKINLQNFTHKAYWDRENGIVYGIPLKISEKGDIIFKPIIIQGTIILDLSKPEQRKDHFILLHSHQLLGGINFKGGTPLIKLHDPNALAVDKIEKRQQMRKADDVIEKFGANDIAAFGILFGINPANTPDVIRMQLYEVAERTPHIILDRYESEDRELWVVVKNGLHYGVLQQKPEGILFGGVNLGLRDDTAVVRLRENPDLVQSIEQAIDERKPKVTNGKKQKESEKPLSLKD